MWTRQNFSLEDFRPFSLIDPCDLEDLRGIQERVVCPAHNGDSAAHELVDGHARVNRRVDVAVATVAAHCCGIK